MKFFAVAKRGRFGAINSNGVLQIGFKFGSIGAFVEGLAPALSRGKWGFIDEAGVFKISPQFTEAYPFCDGFARVRQKDGWGYITRDGILKKERFYRAFDFSDGLAAVQRTMVSDWEYVNQELRIIIADNFDLAMEFKDGLAAVSRDSRWGFVRPDGNVAVEFKYSGARRFSEGLAAVATDEQGELFGFIDKTGKMKIQPRFSGADLVFGNGLAPVWRDEKFGYINTTGEIIIGFSYYDAHPFAEKLAAVSIKQRGETRYGFINTVGEWVIDPQFCFVEDFTDGFARVNSDPDGDDDAWSYVSPTGDYLWSPDSM